MADGQGGAPHEGVPETNRPSVSQVGEGGCKSDAAAFRMDSGEVVRTTLEFLAQSKLSQYSDALAAQQGGLRLGDVKAVTEEDLARRGVTKEFHRLRFLRQARQMVELQLAPEPSATAQTARCVPNSANLQRLDGRPTGHIEQRAVTHAFLRRLTDARVTSAMKRDCSAATIGYLKSRIAELERDIELAESCPLQAEPELEPEPEPEPGSAEAPLRHDSLVGAQKRLRRLRRDLQNHEKAAASGKQYITGRDFHRHVIKADTHDLLCRYAELVGCGNATDADGASSIGDADAFVSWNWDSAWESLLGALGEHTRLATAAGKAAPHYWLDIFAVNQHTALPPWTCESGLGEMCPGCIAMAEDMMSLAEMTAGRKDKGFERVINAECCAELLLLLEPWFDPRPTTRVWCLYEILLTIMAKKTVQVLVPPGERAGLAAALQDDIEEVQRSVGAIRVEHAEATMEADRTQILTAITTLLGSGGFDEMGKLVMERLREWTYEAGIKALETMDPAQRGMSKLINVTAAYLHNQGQLEKAEPLLIEAMLARRESLGGSHQNTLQAVSNLAMLLHDKGDYTQAQPLFEDAVKGLRSTLGDTHASTATAMSHLGQLHETKGQFDVALTLYSDALSARRRTLGDTHLDTLHAINKLGKLLEQKGDLSGAEALISEGFEACKQTLPGDHKFRLAMQNNLGMLLLASNEYDRAQSLLEDVLLVYRRILGDGHPRTLTALANLSSLHQATGNFDESSAYLSEALSARRRIYGNHHPDTLLCMNNLGTLYQATGNYQASARLYEEVAGVSERILGKFHSRTLSTINNLVHLLAEMREYSRAVPFAETYLEAMRRKHGAHHPHSQTASRNLAFMRGRAVDPNWTPDRAAVAEEPRLNPASPWTKAMNDGRCYYWRNSPSDRSLEPPTEGVKRIQEESGAEFEKDYQRLLRMQDMVETGKLNPQSSWTKYKSSGRFFYGNSDGPTLQEPVEGIKEEREMARHIFDKYFVGLHATPSTEPASSTPSLGEVTHAQQESTAPRLDEDAAELVSLGFELSAVLAALEAARGEKEIAANMLLG